MSRKYGPLGAGGRAHIPCEKNVERNKKAKIQKRHTEARKSERLETSKHIELRLYFEFELFRVLFTGK